MAHVYAERSAVVTSPAGVVLSVRRGDRFDADDPIVRDHPGLFDPPVEEATANPGQRRNARR